MEGSLVNDGSLEYLPQVSVQYIYLDFDGELTSYNGEILSIDDVEVKDSALTEERIVNILAELNARYAPQGVVFVSAPPAAAEYSTIYVGKTAAFDPYGSFAGVAETIDEGNIRKADNAFVNLDAASSDSEIISTIAHETDHIIGTLNHGGEGLDAYAANVGISAGVTSSGCVLNQGDMLTIYRSGIANKTIINAGGSMYVSSGGVANSTTINELGYVQVCEGGIARNVDLVGSRGAFAVLSGGSAVNVNLQHTGGDFYVDAGGYVESLNVYTSNALGDGIWGYGKEICILGGGSLSVNEGSVTEEVTVEEAGELRISGGLISGLILSAGGLVSMYLDGVIVSADVYGTINDSLGGGCVSSATVFNGGEMRVVGSAAETVITSGGAVSALLEARMSNTRVSSGGTLALLTNARHSGSLLLDSGAHVSAAPGTIIDFTVAGRTATNRYLVSNLALISGAPSFTITVSTYQTAGEYRLAQGADSLYGSIVIGDNRENFGTLTVNGDTLVYNNASYTLTNRNGNLHLTIEETAPKAIFVYSSGMLTFFGVDIANAVLGVETDNYMYVSSGGRATGTTVNSGGYLYVRSSGTAASTTVNSSGTFHVSNGGSAVNTVLNSKGSLRVQSGGFAADTVVNAGGSLYLSSGGRATGTTVNFGGSFYLSSGGIAENTIVTDSGCFYVRPGGVATDTTAISGGICNVSSGGRVNSNTVNFGGVINVSSNAAAVSNIAKNQGSLCVIGGRTSSSFVTSSGLLFVRNRGVATGNTVDSDGILHVSSNGRAESNTLNRDGSLNVSNGGVAEITTVNSGGVVNVFSGGIASATTVNSIGVINISHGGRTSDTTVNSKGTLYISSGGVADTTTMSNGGNFYVLGGGSAVNNVIDPYGNLSVDSGGWCGSTIISSGGSMCVSNGGAAEHTAVDNYGFFYADGEVRDTTVNFFAFISVGSGGSAFDTTLNYGGCMNIFEQGTAQDTCVQELGYLYIASGGTHRGGLQMNAGAVVTAYDGSVIDFTLTGRTESDGFLINDLSMISGTPSYTITVSNKQAQGSYKLAQGADSFEGILTIGNGTVSYGSVSVNGADLVYEGTAYSLNTSGGDLTLTIFDADELVIAADDLDGNGLADVILRNDRMEMSTALFTAADGSVSWFDLNPVDSIVKILGMGKVSGSNDFGQDIFVLNGNRVAAWKTCGGQVTAVEALYTAAANMEVLGVADFDGDGVTDYLLRSDSGDVGCVMGEGNRWNYFNSLGSEWSIAGTGDFNGDGRDDLLLKHDAGFAGTWLTQEDGSVSWRNLDTLSDGLEILGTGDFNGDGVDDVLIRKGDWAGAWLVEDGRVDSFIGIKHNLTCSVEQIADFDGDGIDDLRIRSGEDIGVLYVKGADSTQWQYFASVGSEWKSAFDAQVV